ncbi:MAG TPA: [LysW]-lysine hydrolase [Roseiflexaceae bacterium]|nr:[LysW]-lysine hydrolase [Roseiflexaceae bacterium]
MSLSDFNSLAMLEQMLRIPSVSGQEGELARFLVEQMRALGFYSYVDDAGNAVGEAGQGPEIVLLGHIDTVPGVVPVRSVDGRLYGRGAVDAKGPFATFVAAAARLLADGQPRARLVLIGAVEEEAASSKGAHYVVDRYAPLACVIGEPSGWDRLTLGYKGRLLVEGRWDQPMAHSAGREAAVAERAVGFWNGLAARCAAHNQGKAQLFEQLLPSLRAISSGSDGLTDWAELTIGIRLPPDVDPDALARELAEEAAGGQLRFRGGCLAYCGDKNNQLVRAFLKGVRAAGGTPGFLLKTGTSDMNVVGPVWRCPILAYGPGDSTLDHTPDEHVEIAEYLRAIDVLELALRQLSAE